MKTRILSGLIMVPLLAVLYFGGYVLMLACFLIGVMAVREFITDLKPWASNRATMLPMRRSWGFMPSICSQRTTTGTWYGFSAAC